MRYPTSHDFLPPRLLAWISAKPVTVACDDELVFFSDQTSQFVVVIVHVPRMRGRISRRRVSHEIMHGVGHSMAHSLQILEQLCAQIFGRFNRQLPIEFAVEIP